MSHDIVTSSTGESCLQRKSVHTFSLNTSQHSAYYLEVVLHFIVKSVPIKLI
jgi:hypothetical protein